MRAAPPPWPRAPSMSTTPRPTALAWWALALAVAVLATAHAWITVVRPGVERFTFDSAEYAVAGRAWLETGRLQTLFIYPAMLGGVPGPPFPLLAGHPLVPALDALVFAIAGPTPDATLVPSLLAFVACVLLVARLALALGGSSAAALGAAAAFAFSPWALGLACEGRSEMPFAALLTAAILLLWKQLETPRPLALGVVLGFAHLARPVVVPLLPAFALGVWLLTPPGRRARSCLLVLAGFLPLAALTALYRWAAAGSPFAGSGSYLLLAGVSPEWAMSRINRMTPPPDALAWIVARPVPFAGKVARGVVTVVSGAFARAPLTGAFAVLAASLALVRGSAARGFVLSLAAMAALLVLFTAATVASSRMLFPLLPAGVSLAFAGIAWLTEMKPRLRRPVLAIVAALAVLGGGVPLARYWHALRFGAPDTSAPATPPVPAEPLVALRAAEWRDLFAAVAPLLPREGLVASDVAPWIAWHMRRPTTIVPLEPSALLTGPRRLAPEAVVLTNEDLILLPLEGDWRRIFQSGEPPTGYRLAGRVHAGRLEAVVFTRDVR